MTRYFYNALGVRLILFNDLSTMKQQSSSIPGTVVEKYQNFNVCTGTGAIRTDLTENARTEKGPIFVRAPENSL